ncbi:DUF885 domain-containing protein [Pseudoalteromonas sp. MMG024]|uniref:DUF885 domain-containing protein n=1 Tax=Pseudoalteromonas sp. MMG024 TaxID=2909980 RepID=UPI001F2A78FF|nr:DUF885 domain-containing protein [Pseudoalteromonas sp. MMG024]MCF6458259.1 DUF885 domain-containing protein [Pseudoalteromonas sp. MMG024]
MIKFTQLLLPICFAFLLFGCDDASNSRSEAQLVTSLKQLNTLLYPSQSEPNDVLWPMSDRYLTLRDSLFKQLLRASEKPSQEAQLLAIEQRFTERFFPWPYNANPVLNYLQSASHVEDADLADFIAFSQQKMSNAYQDKVRLSRFELTALLRQIANAEQQLDTFLAAKVALAEFERYLKDYSPRRSPGVGALPNGKDWYQARLNYFTNAAQKPADVLNRLLTIKQSASDEPQFVVCFTTQKCANTSGLDWRTKYSDRRAEFTAVPFGKEQAVIAEVDFGIHAQAWSSEHALTVLTKQLEIDEERANRVLAKILQEPALAMVNIPLG